VGEPVFLTLALTNLSEKNIFEVQGYLHPANDFEIQVARSSEIPKRFTAGLREDVLVPGVTFRLRPREVSTLRWPLCYEPDHPNGFLFDPQGQYSIACQVRVAINQTPRILTLPELQLNIQEPTAEEMKAQNLILRPECAEDLQRLQAHDKTVNIWREIIERFPKSLWAPYAKVLLVRQALDSGKSDYGEAAKWLEELVRDPADFPLCDDVFYLSATYQDRLGRPLEALRWLYRIQREYPLSPYIHASNRLFRKYIYQAGWEQRYSPWYVRE